MTHDAICGRAFRILPPRQTWVRTRRWRWHEDLGVLVRWMGRPRRIDGWILWYEFDSLTNKEDR